MSLSKTIRPLSCKNSSLLTEDFPAQLAPVIQNKGYRRMGAPAPQTGRAGPADWADYRVFIL